MSRPPVPFQRPLLPAWSAIEPYVERAYGIRWFSNGGPCAKLLRDRLRERSGVPCVPVANATVGLMAAIAALLPELEADGPREVLLPSFTFAATIQAAIWAGLEPRFLDVAPGHWHLDPEALEAALAERGDRVALVLAVTTFGTPPPASVSASWRASCSAAGVPLLADAAAGFGGIDANGVPVGALGDIDVVSFHATKPFAIGEGGAVFSRHEELLERVERAANFGLQDGQATMRNGLNAKMSELHAATALATLDLYDDVLAARRGASAEIRHAVTGVEFQTEGERGTWQFVPTAFADREAREAAELRCAGTVEVRRYYRPLHQMEPFRAVPTGAGGLRVTEQLSDRLLCFPMANDLTPDERSTVARAIQPA